MPKLKYDSVFIENLVKEYNQGKTTVDLGKKYNIAPTQIGSLLRRGGYTPRKPLTQTIDRELVIKLKQEGKTNREIAEILGVKLLTLKDMKINTDSPLKSKYGVKYTKDLEFFSNIDTQLKAYVLGFITADGSINDLGALRIELSLKDGDHLKAISKALCPDYIPKETHRDRVYKGEKKTVSTLCFNITCTAWRDDLFRLGVVPNKTYKSLSIPNLASDLYRHYIRGYFDGNGHVGKNKLKVDLCGGHTLLEDILKKLQAEGIALTSSVAKKPNQADSVFHICKREYIAKLYTYLYEDATLYLERKKQAFICHLTP